MSKYFWLIVFMLYAGSGNIQSVVIFEDDVIIGVSLPDWSTVCITSSVHSGTDGMYPVRYSVQIGETVRLHDQSLPDGTWVSIGTAQWVLLENLCR